MTILAELAKMTSTDKAILIACNIAMAGVLIAIMWWLDSGRQEFLEKRHPERLKKEMSAAAEQKETPEK